MRGALIKARAMAIICCSPPERDRVFCFLLDPKIGKKSYIACFLSTIETFIANKKGSHIQILLNRHICKHPTTFGDAMAIPRETMTSVVRNLCFLSFSEEFLVWQISSPSNVIEPATKGSCPTIALRSVLLPLPLAPIRQTISPWFTCMLTFLESF